MRYRRTRQGAAAISSKAIRWTLLVMVAAASMPGRACAATNEFPVRPLRLITIFAAGAAADQHARYIAGRFSEQLSQNVIVENKPGAGGVVGTREALRARPLGYTLLLTNQIGRAHV